MSLMPQVQETEASADITEMYDQIRREMGIPFVPNIDKTLAISPNMLKGSWEVLRNVFLRTSLPTSLASMILFAISSANKCNYCSPIFKVTCMTVGINEETLAALEDDLEALTPERTQATIRFAQKCAFDRGNLTADDFDTLRQQGLDDAEIVEIITLAALAVYLNTIADSLKVDMDDAISAALSG
jgi:uncharacterized peroxidase-related enzyme